MVRRCVYLKVVHFNTPFSSSKIRQILVSRAYGRCSAIRLCARHVRSADTSWFSRSCFTKSDDKVPIVLLLKYYTYNRGATTQTAETLSAGGLGLVAPGGTPGKIKWPELGVTELRFRDR